MSEAAPMNTEEYLSINELASRLKLKPKTVKNKMSNGTFAKGVHYVSPKGLRPRFKWSAIVAWLEEKEDNPKAIDGGGIPMARGYYLGEHSTEKN